MLDKGLSGTTAPGITIVVADLESVIAGFPIENEFGKELFTLGWKYGFDTGLDDVSNADFERELSRRLEAEFPTEDSRGWRSIMVSSRANDAADFRASYGGLFFIGIVLVTVVSVFVNKWIMFPFFTVVKGYPMADIIGLVTKVFPFADTEWKVLILVTAPFNLVKAILIMAITRLIYKPLSPILHAHK